jgi:hypothetical protein
VGSKSLPHVAVLGAGIMGASLAIFLARKGVAVSLFDAEEAPMSGASRWNEGKIHLGYLYGADKTLNSARHLIPAGLAFAPLMQRLLGQSLQGCTTEGDDIFLIHRDSVINAAQAKEYYREVSEMVRSAPGADHYLIDVRKARCDELSFRELGAISDTAQVGAGFRVPERSVQTNWIADRLCAAVALEPCIHQRMGVRVTAVHPCDDPEGRWQVCSRDGLEDFDCVVNTLWQNRILIDKTAGLQAPVEWSKRYRLALFVRTQQKVSTPSSVLAVGPFGDIKNYNGRDFYLSWYPAGLAYETDNTMPGTDFTPTGLDVEAISSATRAGLSNILAGVDDILDNSSKSRLAGGWVFAQGRGSLASPASSLHRRDRFGVCRVGRYYSVDTGKYSLAPWMAESLSREIAGT